MIRLIGIDVDGTLLDSEGRLPEANREAIVDAVASGIHVALVTGRSYPFARPVADPLPASVTLIVSNGAVERSTDGTTLARRLLDRVVAAVVLEATRPYRDAAALRALADTLRRDAVDFAVSLTEYVHRDFSLIDVTAPTATKGRALAWRAEQLGLTRDQVMAVGDNFNDLDMLEYAGVAVVMANAVEGLTERGWPMTGHQNEAGLAEAIRQFALR